MLLMFGPGRLPVAIPGRFMGVGPRLPEPECDDDRPRSCIPRLYYRRQAPRPVPLASPFSAIVSDPDSAPRATKPNPAGTPERANEADRSVGRRIAASRAGRAVSQAALADALGIELQRLQTYETGHAPVGPGHLQAIADHLGVPTSLFFPVEGAPADSATGPEDALDYLGIDGALDLLRAYNAIPDDRIRRAMLALVRTAARLDRAADPNDA